MSITDASLVSAVPSIEVRESALLDAAQLIVEGLDRAQFDDATAFVRFVATRTLDLALTVFAGADVRKGAPNPQVAKTVYELAQFVESATLDELDDAYAQLLACEPRIELASGRLRLLARPNARRRHNSGLTTPEPVVNAILDASLDQLIADARSQSDPIAALLAIRVIDLACGGGRFLVSAARRISTAAVVAKSQLDNALLSPQEIVALRLKVIENCVFGVDRDPAAVSLCRVGLLAFVSEHDTDSHARVNPVDLRDTLRALRTAPDDLGRIQRGLLQRIRVGDPLVDLVAEGSVQPVRGFDLVLCNPPNATSTVGRATKDRRRANAMRDRFGDRFKGFVDSPTLYLLLGLELAREGRGLVAMVQPTGLISGANNAKLRTELLSRGELVWLWMTEQQVGDATTRTAAVVVRRNEHTPQDNDAVTIARGPIDGQTRETLHLTCGDLLRAPTWSHLVIDTSSIPCPQLVSRGVVSDLVEVSADFRDQYYGLVGAVVEHAKVCDRVDVEGEAQLPKLVTSGLIDPHQLLWGQRTTTFNRQRFESPRVDLASLRANPRLLQWCQSRLQPKILLATQTRILEGVVDQDGVVIPSVPVISIHGDVDVLWKIAAVLHTPVISAWMAVRVLDDSTAQSALKVNATQTRALPLPCDAELWDQAVRLNQQVAGSDDQMVRLDLLLRAAVLMHRAYGLTEEQSATVTEWWQARSRFVS